MSNTQVTPTQRWLAFTTILGLFGEIVFYNLHSRIGVLVAAIIAGAASTWLLISCMAHGRE